MFFPFFQCGSEALAGMPPLLVPLTGPGATPNLYPLPASPQRQPVGDVLDAGAIHLVLPGVSARDGANKYVLRVGFANAKDGQE